MTQPAAPETDPTGSTVTLPPAPAPAPAPQPAPVPAELLNNPAVQAAIETARQQEKDKLYPTVQQLQTQQAEQAERLKVFEQEREAREKREAEAIAAAAAAAEEKRQAELSYGEKLAETEQRFSGQIGELQQQIAQRDVILEKERQYNELMTYRSARLATDDESDPASMILPELRDLVAGNTREEIDQSISALAERSGAILQQVAQARGMAQQSARGTGVTVPPVGPMDNNSGHQTVTAEEIRNMDMQTYAANRGRLLGAASQQQRDKGMFG